MWTFFASAGGAIVMNAGVGVGDHIFGDDTQKGEVIDEPGRTWQRGVHIVGEAR